MKQVTIEIRPSLVGNGADVFFKYSEPVTLDNCEDIVFKTGLAIQVFLTQKNQESKENSLSE